MLSPLCVLLGLHLSAQDVANLPVSTLTGRTACTDDDLQVCCFVVKLLLPPVISHTLPHRVFNSILGLTPWWWISWDCTDCSCPLVRSWVVRIDYRPLCRVRIRVGLALALPWSQCVRPGILQGEAVEESACQAGMFTDRTCPVKRVAGIALASPGWERNTARFMLLCFTPTVHGGNVQCKGCFCLWSFPSSWVHIALQQPSQSPSSPAGRVIRRDFLLPSRSAALIYCSSSSSTSGGQRAADISP